MAGDTKQQNGTATLDEEDEKRLKDTVIIIMPEVRNLSLKKESSNVALFEV